MNELAFLTLDEVLRIHARSLAEHGGTEGVRDLGLVDSAVACNGVYAAPPKWEFYLAMIAVAEKRMAKPALAEILRRAAGSPDEPKL